MRYKFGDQQPLATSYIFQFYDTGLRGQLPDDIQLPPSVTIPFSSFEQLLKDPQNKGIAKELEAAIREIPTTSADKKLAAVRELVMKVLLLFCCSHGNCNL